MKPKNAQRTAVETNNLAGEGLLIVDGSFRPIALDCGAQAILDDVNAHCGRSDGAGTLPPEILSLLNARSDLHSDAAEIGFSSGDHDYRCRTFLVRPRNGSAIQPMLALHLKRELSIAEAVHQVSVDYRLTDREQEALMGVSMGLSSKELAARMNISPNTVKAFLRLIMIKMGTSNRAGIIGKLLDPNGRLRRAATSE
jgi:DNA-binding CsgD family transcriptional regulator